MRSVCSDTGSVCDAPGEGSGMSFLCFPILVLDTDSGVFTGASQSQYTSHHRPGLYILRQSNGWKKKIIIHTSLPNFYIFMFLWIHIINIQVKRITINLTLFKHS